MMESNHLLRVLYILFLVGVMNIGSTAQTKNTCSCVGVIKHQQSVDREWCKDVNLSDSETVEVMSCLLKFRGDKSPVWGVVTNNNVSQTFGPSPLEVVALFQISRLFYRNENFADAMVLMDEHDRQNAKESIRRAYIAYANWLKKVKKIGLEEMRRRQTDPLASSGVSWY